MSHAQERMSATSRVLTLLALLAGLLAMHGLAGSAHAAHAAAAPMSHTAADMSVAPNVLTASGTGSADPVAAPSWRGDGAVMVAMVLCLVVLGSLGLALLALRLRRHRLPGTETPVPARIRSSPSPRGPPPDLLSVLCVLRT